MQKLRLRKGMKIGDLAAENDRLLTKVFVDQGHVDNLLDTTDPRFLILGRTGSGKTALMKHIAGIRAEHFANLNPEELSMQYIHNSPVLRSLIAAGANMDIFYKFLWRHVCILEVIRMRYGTDEDVPSYIRQIIDLVSNSKRDETRAKAAAKEYLREYGDQFWITADSRIKKIVDEVETKFTSDQKIGAWLEANPVKIGGESTSGTAARTSQSVEREVVDRAQSIVSDYLLADLRYVVELLGRAGFNDPQKRYYLLIDDLDKNWMPDDALYLDLTKSLLQTVYDLNRSSPLQGVKIIVALRENAYHRIFQKTSAHESQREKWLDVQVRLRWGKEELETLVDNRLHELFRRRIHPDTSDVSVDTAGDSQAQWQDRD
jgi:energy-coupling factor transporter ATP-binding protein EcfA2